MVSHLTAMNGSASRLRLVVIRDRGQSGLLRLGFGLRCKARDDFFVGCIPSSKR